VVDGGAKVRDKSLKSSHSERRKGSGRGRSRRERKWMEIKGEMEVKVMENVTRRKNETALCT
jgi:hypothetical protein